MSALEDDIATLMEARRLHRAVCERAWDVAHRRDRREHLRQLALHAVHASTTLDIVVLRLRALGIDVKQLNDVLDESHEAMLRLVVPVLAEAQSDTPEQAAGRIR